MSQDLLEEPHAYVCAKELGEAIDDVGKTTEDRGYRTWTEAVYETVISESLLNGSPVDAIDPSDSSSTPDVSAYNLGVAGALALDHVDLDESDPERIMRLELLEAANSFMDELEFTGYRNRSGEFEPLSNLLNVIEEGYDDYLEGEIDYEDPEFADWD